MTLTVDLAVFEKEDNEAIERYVADLPAERLAEALLFISTLRKALGTGEKFLVSRINEDHVLIEGETWKSPDDREFMWAGDRHRECNDPDGLRLALTPLVNDSASLLAIRAFREAFKPETKVYLTALDRIAQLLPDTKSTIDDFLTWKSGANKLRPLDKDGR